MGNCCSSEAEAPNVPLRSNVISQQAKKLTDDDAPKIPPISGVSQTAPAVSNVEAVAPPVTEVSPSIQLVCLSCKGKVTGKTYFRPMWIRKSWTSNDIRH